jgi:hypothetical protein
MPKVNVPTESQLRILISGDAADVIAKLEETTGKLIERAVVECDGDHRALFTYVGNIWNAYVLEMTYARRG